MKMWLWVLLAAGCAAGTGTKPIKDNHPAHPNVQPSSPELPVNTGETAGTADTGAPPETVPVTVVSITPTPPAPCPYAVDATAVADCAAGSYAALHAGLGYASVQAAADVSAPGDTITVCPGSWPGGLLLGAGRSLVAADPTPGATTLDAAGTSRVIESQDATLIGLTVTNGVAAGISGIYDTGTMLVLECMLVSNNQNAGGTYYNGSYYEDENVYGSAGGAYALGMTVRYSTFSGNGAEYDGGAIVADTALVEDSIFVDNYAGSEGGALSVASLEVRRSELLDNRSGIGGGAIHAGGAHEAGSLLLEDTLFDGNISYGEGAAISIGSWETDPTSIARSLFENNRTVYGGAVLSLGTWGGIDLTISDSTFRSNLGSATIGADGWVEQGGIIQLERSIFEDNQGSTSGFLSTNASDQAAIDVLGTDLIVHRNAGGVGAVYLRAGDTLDCTNCDFGTGVNDNTPSDAHKGGVNYASVPLNFTL